MAAKIVHLIYTTDRRGTGEEGSPIRDVPQLWTRDGKFVCGADPAEKICRVDYSQLLRLEE